MTIRILIPALLLTFAGAGFGDEVQLSFGHLDDWRAPTGTWQIAGDASLDPENAKALLPVQGMGVGLNGPEGRTEHLISKIEHGDVELHIEFMVPEGSNSGVYLQGRYEIQVLDSWGVEELQHSDCGGIYQRYHEGADFNGAERGYEGRPPRVNASTKPGTWQSFDIVFRAPRFDEAGNKIANAAFLSVKHNGVLIHENEELSGPTRAAAYQDEKPLGPLMLQGDHGPVAFRNVRLRELD